MPSLQFAPTYTHTQRHLPNAVLAQTMQFLAQPLAQLAETLQEEVAKNPALEIIDDAPARCPRCHTPLVAGACPRCTRPSSKNDEPIVFLSPASDHHFPSPWHGEDGSDPEEVALIQTIDLPTYVGRQISPDLNDPAQRRIAAFLLSNLDEDGLLTTTPLEAAYALRVSPQAIEEILAIIQQCDPLGVGSPSPQAAMLAQARTLAAEGEFVPKAVFTILAFPEGMRVLGKEGSEGLARRLDLSAAEVNAAVTYITENLNPYPARAAWGERRLGLSSPAAPTIVPDVVISYHNDDPAAPLVVEVLTPFAGRLRVDPLFRQAVKLANGHGAALREQLERAAVVVKSLRQRENTMLRLMRLLAKLQRKFIIHGDEFLNPMTRAEAARRLEVSESTMSRAVAGKLVQFPNGKVVSLARFFDTSLPVRAVLRRLVAEERSPQSDEMLARRLKALGFSVARRTVAKYRGMEHIPPAHQRRRQAV